MRPLIRASITAGVLSCVAASAPAVTFTDLYALTPLPANFQQTILDIQASGGQAGGTGYYGFADTNPNDLTHAVLWTGPTTVVDLHPTGYKNSYLEGIGGGQQVGHATAPFNLSGSHALLWRGTNAVVDLHPAFGYSNSRAFGVGNGQQVGWGTANVANGGTRALLWNGTNKATDLHPSGFFSSEACGTDGVQQVSLGRLTGNNDGRALLWNGTNAAIDLHPAGFKSSNAYAVGDGQQGGSGVTNANVAHALLWNGTNEAIDLHPAGYAYSYVRGVDDGRQVGFGRSADGVSHALLWTGTADGLTDLNAFLPATFSSAIATSIVGDTVYGFAFPTAADGVGHAVTWTIPEPAALSLLAVGGGLALRRRRR